MTLGDCPFGLLILLTVSATVAFGEPKWGRAQERLQLGIDWHAGSTESESALQVSLRNTGAEPRAISVGIEGSEGPIYDVQITTVRDQPPGEYLVFDVNALKAQPSSLPSMKQVRLGPGATYVFRYPLKQLICVVNRRDTPLEDLLKQGYSVRASFKVSNLELRTPDFRP